MATRREIVLPEVVAEFGGAPGRVVVKPAQTYQLDSVELEYRLTTVVPDVLAFIQAQPIAIEIRVTHEVDETKESKLRDLSLSPVEIDLSTMPRSIDWEVLEALVVDEVSNKSWIFSRESLEFRKNVLSASTCFPVIKPGQVLQVDGCPLWKRTFGSRVYANIDQDCRHCENGLEFAEDLSAIWCNATQSVFQGELLKRNA